MSIWDIIFARKNNIEEEAIRKNFGFFDQKANPNIITGDEDSSLGWGVFYRGKKFVTHSRLSVSDSALVTLSDWQKGAFTIIFLLLAVGLFIDIKLTLVVVIALLSVVYFADFIFSLYVLLKSLSLPPEIKFQKENLDSLNDQRLPYYTILCPLYREEKILPHFMSAIEAINWPKEKLDVMLLLEEDDQGTILAAQKANLPSYVKIVVVPNSLPKTKPKACNFGLGYAKGKYIVVYDAEDRPDPMQLKKAYLAFESLPPEVVCLQSKLNYYNPEQNVLTRLFTAEYSLWFDLVLPGLQSIKSVIPLGGTSNHFKTVVLKDLGGWDAFNVTEDCDLGARLFKKGFKTEIIDSTTFEEANSNLKGWIRQRSRWIKGYVQTYLVHMRDPINFLKIHGIHAFVFQLVIGMRMVFILINPVLWATTYSYFAFHSTVGAYIESLYPAPVFYIAVFSLVFGNFLHFYNYMIGCAKRGHWNLIRYVFLIPFYWLFASLASVVAFYQLAVKPHFWEKTEHGLHLTKPAFTEIKFSFEFDTGFPKIAGNFIHGLFNPFVVLTKNVIDILDVFGPLPDLENKKGSMRILVLNWRDTKHVWAGGAEVYIQEVAKRWVRDGNNVTIFCGWDGKSLRNEAVDGVNIIRRGGFYTVYLFAFIYYQLRFKSSFDVIVDCENGIPFFTPLYADIPKVLLIHHVHQEVFRKHLPFPLSKIALFLESFLMPNLYRFIPIVTISKSSRDDIIRLGWGDEENVDIVNPGFSLQSDSRYLKTTYPSFLYLGRLKAYKNVDTAISAFAQINSKYKNSRLTIAGFGEDLPNLIRLIKRLKIEDSVTFAGKVDEGEKLKLLSESWVCLQPSSIEGWGITVIEANACGTPVIASDVKGLRDSVKNGETGFLVEPRNPDAFAAAMEYLISNSEKIRNLSMNAVFWSENFSWDKSSWELMTLLNREVGKNREFIPSLETVEDRR